MSHYITADPHFNGVSVNMGFRNYFKNCKSIKEVNNILISNWNSTVKAKHDKVFIVGDFYEPIDTMTYQEMLDDYKSIMSSLNGLKHLILGNHDKGVIKSLKDYTYVGFDEVSRYPIIYNSFYILSHEPIFVNPGMAYVNIYGHVHDNDNYKNYSSCGYCVSMDRTNFRPILFEEVQLKIKQERDLIITSKF